VDGTGSGVIIFLEPVPKLFPRFGTGPPAYVFSKDIGQALTGLFYFIFIWAYFQCALEVYPNLKKKSGQDEIVTQNGCLLFFFQKNIIFSLENKAYRMVTPYIGWRLYGKE
jgi:hypothetical protein